MTPKQIANVAFQAATDFEKRMADLEAENKRLRGALIACLEKGKRWHPCDPVVVKANAALESKHG